MTTKIFNTKKYRNDKENLELFVVQTILRIAMTDDLKSNKTPVASGYVDVLFNVVFCCVHPYPSSKQERERQSYGSFFTNTNLTPEE